MRKLFWLLGMLWIVQLHSQTYNNEWIDFSKMYYKFKVGRNGVYRITQPSLAAIGLGNTPVEQFKLFRNGNEIALFTSVSNGPLPAGGYIEFWGEANDGKTDRALYRNPQYQHTDKISFQTDTSIYFLTTITGTNKRFTNFANPGPSTLPVETYFIYTQGQYFRTKNNLGYAEQRGENIYSSSYDKGEFFSSRDILPAAGSVLTDIQKNLFVYVGGPTNAQLKFGASGNSKNLRNIRVRLNGTVLKDTACNYFDDIVSTSLFPISLLAGNTASMEFINTSVEGTDRMVVSHYEISYARQFNFGGNTNFTFQLPAKAAGYNLEITNFNNGSTSPVLYDLELNERYTGDISAPGRIKFVLAGSIKDRQLVLISQDNSNITNVQPAELQQKTFTNFSTTTNQGDYVIISSPILYKGTNNNNPIADYKNYRNSIAGGGYNVLIVDIEELVDQFAFGIRKHPLSIKNFLRYARAAFSTANIPKYILLIGHGTTYRAYRQNLSSPQADALNMIPTWGEPASDMMLSSADAMSAHPLTPIGRISAVSAKEIEDYLEKVKEYENAQQNSPHTIAGRLWMKNVLQVTGASDLTLGTLLCASMDSYRTIAEDSLFGGKVYTFCKNTVTPVEQFSNKKVTELFEEGLTLLNYFGHSSSTTLEFNIDNPQSYNNQGKYPVFSVNGCNAGNFYTFNPQRFSTTETISEKFVLAKQRGSIAFIASTHFGLTDILDIYLTNFYSLSTKDEYQKSLGVISQRSSQFLSQVFGNNYLARTHAEQITLHGDPAIRLNLQDKPDYIIEESQIKIAPQFISVAQDSFAVGVKIHNMGRVTKDSLLVTVLRQYPDNLTEAVFRNKIKPVLYADSLKFQIPILPLRDVGLNKITVTLDSANNIAEISENNNGITKEFYIYEDEIRPVVPHNYAIVSQQNTKLYASTANPLTPNRTYVFEMDTTSAFNSPLKVSKTIASIGGVIEFQPGITYRDGVVYYWRVGIAPATATTRWSDASFLYKAGYNSASYNQSHYYQHLNSDTSRISLGSDRKWKYGLSFGDLFVRNGVFPTASSLGADYTNAINNNNILGPGCNYDEVIFQVIDPATFKPLQNNFSGGTGLYNSLVHSCGAGRQFNFAYLLGSSADRKKAMDFIDIIPAGSYVIARSNTNPNVNSNTYINAWKSDTALFGSGNSLYHKLYAQGCTAIDSFTQPRAWSFVFRKNSQAEFTTRANVSTGINDLIPFSVQCPTLDTAGTVTSPLFGPAKAWKKVYWQGVSVEEPSNDRAILEVIGINTNGQELALYQLNQNQAEQDISAINAQQYPFLKLRITTVDSITISPYQLQSWRIDYDMVPEGALAANLLLTGKDTLEVGENLNFGIAFKNINTVPFDSMKMRAFILDRNNVPKEIELPRKRPIASEDTLQLKLNIDSKEYPELNTLFVEFNARREQPEQYSFNNFLYKNFYVKADNKAPLLDVTFDNMHILDKDIVSPTPHIQVKLKDDAKFLLLNDTAGVEVQIKFPDALGGETRTYQYSGDTLRFTPAASGADNTATIDFFPSFTRQADADGDDYELIVKGKDRSNNKAGAVEYRVGFKIITKPMISNLLNFPNPFTTSTAFVFTLTGSTIPDNMKIQILTVTGKVVREITRAELGTLHIGRNVTEYKWDGTDQYGQRLANGVYLYRFISSLNGKQLDKYTQNFYTDGTRLPKGENTDRFFNNGYGKMYLMR